MSLVDGLFIIMLVILTGFIVLLSVATLYLLATMRDLHAAMKDARSRLHQLVSRFSDLESQAKRKS